MKKIYELIDRVWGLISEAVFLRFEFDLPAEKIAEFQKSGRATFVLTHGGMVEWLILSSWSRRNGFGAILVVNRKRILLFSKPLYFFQVLFRHRTIAELFLDEKEGGPRLLFCPKSERKQPFVPTRTEKLLGSILERVGNGPRANWITLVPILIVWRKHARSEGRQLIEYLWGLSSSPNFIGQMWYLARRRKDSTVRYLGSLNLHQLEDEGAPSSEPAPLVAAKALRRKILVTVNQEMRVLLGPRFLSPVAVKETIAQHPEIVAQVKKIAAEEKVDPRVVERRVYKNLTEISANYTFRAIEVLYVLLTWLFNKVFEGVVVDDQEFQNLREIGKTKPVVYLPCHRSHLDYLVLPYSLFIHDMVTPHIAAGINLAFWPIGYFLRIGGAFFIRRSFRSDPLYALCLKKYVEHLLKSKYTLMFFIEGTRSRSGKMMAPQFGMLKMIMETCQKNLVEDIVLAPVAICYDEIPEQGSYSKELAGAEKKKESAGELIKSRAIVKKKFGRVYVRVAEPLSAREALNTMQGPDDFLALQKTAFHICKKITDVTPITPKSLASAVLLSHHSTELSLEDIFRCTNSLAEFALKHKRPVVFSDGVSLRKNVEQIMRQVQTQNIVTVNDGVPRTFSCDIVKRSILNFYKNNSIHIFVTFSLSLLTFLEIADRPDHGGKIHRDQWLDKILNLRNLLKFDFFFEPTPVFTLEVELLWREYWGYDGGETARLDVLKAHLLKQFVKISDLSVYYRILGEILEGYLTMVQFTISSKAMKIEKKSLLQRVLKYADVRELQGSLVFSESRSSQNYANALSLMENLKLVIVGEKSMVELRPQEEGLKEIEKDFVLYLEVLQRSPEHFFRPSDPLTRY